MCLTGVLATASARAEDESPAPDLPQLAEPQRIVYGVGVVSEAPLAAGSLCRDDATCILGSGVGILARAALATSHWADLGVAYSLTRQNSARLYRLATLQQLRMEGRYTFATGRTVEPFVAASAGVAGYGNEWGLDTWAPTASLGAGALFELDKDTFVSAEIDYRVMRFAEFADQTGRVRLPAIVHMLGLRLTLEARGKL